ncbi:UDP-N-acetylmuramoyl-tripeptide--D-alanyl-D-alanine ligase [Nocardioides sp. Kera G14]|uniref:UDP-N-acetylmuramoyl-tripeptide--D-alanyl-D- alanine ligase n=1 Tax=Nocardioides sp. Kera G14 TaxID=2884264 RepID=UPI001D122DD7|nr:UDP-N-acetylmuramoyl-tripeptide--D-alanyl-D-alanine ligase [Nocardioides sp. Kera G14]UDY22688.1 UDP-N-acetylmuramoyl-tripeptide--D-alanyl-D-alanine ligase [Nocardioides sp. Kera G14]
MIPLHLEDLATIVGGKVHGAEGPVEITAPAVLDGRQAEPGGLFVAFAGEYVDGHEYADQAAAAGAVAVIGSRPTSLPTVVVDDVQVALQALAAHVLRELRATGDLTVLGLTGSQGKTSTKDLLSGVLTQGGATIATLGSFNNELGVPLTILRADASTRFLALEMGARGIGHIADLTAIAPLDVAIVLNVGEAHLGEFGSREAIVRAKSELVQGLVPGGTAVLNADDPRVIAMRAHTDGPVLTFGTAEHADVRVEALQLDRLGRPTFQLHARGERVDVSLPVVGAHQAFNAAAAAAAGLAVGVPLQASAEALSHAALSKWRMELHELGRGITLLNDSYNANPDSMRAALDALVSIEPTDGGRRIAVLGPMLELGESSQEAHRGIGEYAVGRADLVLVIGEGASEIAEGAVGGTSFAITAADNAEAIAWLKAQLQPGDVVLVKASRGARLDEVAAALS